MAEATAVTGRLDTPVAAGMIVVAAVAALVVMHRIIIKIH
jgi:hypothetical protein